MTARFKTPLILAALLGSLLIFASTASADAPKVFLNGVDITGVTQQEFENTTVKIDGTGNIYLVAPQYQVEVQDPNAGSAGQTAAPGAVAGNYFVVGSNTKPGNAQYDIVIYVNGAMHKTFKNNESQLVLDITDKMGVGSNTITFQAKKVIEGERKSTASGDSISVFIGKGSATGNQLTIDKQLGTFAVDASQTADKTETFTFQAE